jgi:twitching motility protein PilT
MFLLDESLFNLWKDGLVEKEEILLKSSKPAELAARITNAEKGLYDDESDADEEEGFDDEHEEDEDEEPPPRRPRYR